MAVARSRAVVADSRIAEGSRAGVATPRGVVTQAVAAATVAGLVAIEEAEAVLAVAAVGREQVRSAFARGRREPSRQGQELSS